MNMYEVTVVHYSRSDLSERSVPVFFVRARDRASAVESAVKVMDVQRSDRVQFLLNSERIVSVLGGEVSVAPLAHWIPLGY